MHELGLAEGILTVALEIGGGRPVGRVAVRVGSLQRVAPDSLQFGFRLLAEGTDAASAMLEVEIVPARLQCVNCNFEGEVDAGVPLCPQCVSGDVRVVDGDQVLVDEVELADRQHTLIRRPGSSVTEPPHTHVEEPSAT